MPTFDQSEIVAEPASRDRQHTGPGLRRPGAGASGGRRLRGPVSPTGAPATMEPPPRQGARYGEAGPAAR